MSNNDLLIICGPTSSGKSYLALEIAKRQKGVIVNADSMQLYKDLPIITASPSQEYKNTVPHLLYNYLPSSTIFSVADYLNEAVKQIIQVSDSKSLPIIVGGSGMYINALLHGISLIPEINLKFREEAINIVSAYGIENLYKELAILDPSVISRLKPTDTQRIIRAYEVIRQTGNSIFYYQNLPHNPPFNDFHIKILYLLPERKFLYNNCNKRFVELLNDGGLEEVIEFKKKHPDLTAGPAKTLGVRELTEYINCNLMLPAAIDLAQTKTRQYAKRQITWFNNQIKLERTIIQYSNAVEFKEKLTAII